METVTVDLGRRSYPIHVGTGLLSQSELVTPHFTSNQVVIVTNATVAAFYLEPLLHALDSYDVSSVLLPDGEQFKTLDDVGRIFDHLLTGFYGRQTTLIALGGGVVGDMTGFAAACYQRGIAFVQIPTTLLAQVDSSVGGKTGVNHALGKNMIGAFYQPRCVVVDIDVLNTLDKRQLQAGLAEVIKYGVIYDAAFFDWLEAHIQMLLARDTAALTHAICRSCQCKATIVAADEREVGMRALLNLGHTFGHAIETAEGYGNWLHGEAIACGMVMAAEFSVMQGYIGLEDCERIRAVLVAAGLPVDPPTGIDAQQFLQLMRRDKKVMAGKLRLILLRNIGNAFVTEDFSMVALTDFIRGRLSA